jgi:hypothetical protein
MTGLLCALVCLGDGCNWFVSLLPSGIRQPVRAATLGVVLALLIVQTDSALAFWRLIYAKGTRLGMPGARRMRVREQDAEAIHELVAELQTRCTSFLVFPGFSSLYFWTGSQPPTLDLVPHQTRMISDERLVVMRTALERSSPCVVRCTGLAERIPDPRVDVWLQGRFRRGRSFASCTVWSTRGSVVLRPEGRIPASSRLSARLVVVMTSPANLTALADLSGRWIERAQVRRARTALVLDIDSSVSPTYGTQEGTAYNGHFACTCYHPLFVFNQDGDLARCGLRPGNVHSAHDWREVLDPVVARYRGQTLRRLLRGDAAFALPDVYEYLEAEGFQYAIRLPANQVLQAQIAPLLTRPVGRPRHDVRRFDASFRYQAQSWSRSRRVVAKVEWHPGELLPRVGFIVTNLRRPAKKVVAFYNGRGTAEQWIKEGKHAIKWTRLSCTTFRANAVRLQLHALAYNLANLLRTLALPGEVAGR